jgi:hypothetical protein
MKVGTSKSKGNRFERDIAKKLSIWYFQDPDALIRNPGSGSIATIRSAQNGSKEAYMGIPAGDIMQIKRHDLPFPFSVEVKHHKVLVLEHLLFEKKNSLIYKFWRQCTRDAGISGKIPLMIFKENYKNPVVCLENTPELSSKIKVFNPWHYILTKSFCVTQLDNFLEDPTWANIFSDLEKNEEINQQEEDCNDPIF